MIEGLTALTALYVGLRILVAGGGNLVQSFAIARAVGPVTLVSITALQIVALLGLPACLVLTLSAMVRRAHPVVAYGAFMVIATLALHYASFFLSLLFLLVFIAVRFLRTRPALLRRLFLGPDQHHSASSLLSAGLLVVGLTATWPIAAVDALVMRDGDVLVGRFYGVVDGFAVVGSPGVGPVAYVPIDDIAHRYPCGVGRDWRAARFYEWRRPPGGVPCPPTRYSAGSRGSDGPVPVDATGRVPLVAPRPA